uniref:Secreted protein n=1 Tax=Physcomitrium patens TaxID=3218 RepID=A0A2K1IQJ1_PHYPA|nr:hypothetical protein PHYPA_025671 [Physcomitrium patens]
MAWIPWCLRFVLSVFISNLNSSCLPGHSLASCFCGSRLQFSLACHSARALSAHTRYWVYFSLCRARSFCPPDCFASNLVSSSAQFVLQLEVCQCKALVGFSVEYRRDVWTG